MKQNPFDNIIQQKADNHKAPVPVDAWANIEKMKRKRRPVAFWWLLGLLLFIGLGTFSYYMVNSSSSAGKGATSQKINNIAGDTSTNNGINKKSINSKVIDTQGNTNTATASKITTEDQENNSSVTKQVATIPVANTAGNSFNKAENDITRAKANSYRKLKSRAAGKFAISIASAQQTTDTDNNDISVNTHTRKSQTIKGIQKINTRIVSPVEDNKDESGTQKSDSITEPVTTMAAKNINKDTAMLSAQTAIADQPKPVPPAMADIKQKKKDLSSKKHSLFIDAGITGFFAVQHKDELLSINRTTVTPDNKATFIADKITSSPQASFGYTLALRKKISNRIYIGAGIQYSVMKEKVRLSGTETNTNYAFIKRLESNSTGAFLINDTVSTTTSGIRNITAINSYRFITIPLFIQYKMAGNNVWQLAFSGGAYFNISSYKNSITGNLEHQYSTAHGTNEQQNKLTIDIYTGVRFSRFFGQKYQLYIEPGFQYNFIKYNMPNMINNKYIHKAGISFGVSYTIGK